MKKINYFSTILVVLIGIVTSIMDFHGNVVVFLKNISIVLTVAFPYIYNKFSLKKLPDLFTTLWIIFIFMAHYIGVIKYGYNAYAGYDKLVHTVSGFLTAYVAVIILSGDKVSNKALAFIFIISFSMLCAGLWEIFEFTCNALVGGDAQRVAETGVDDTMFDIIDAFCASILTGIIYVLNKR